MTITGGPMETQVSVTFMGNIVYPAGMADAKRIQHFIDYLIQESVTTNVLLLRQGGVHVSKETSEGVHKGVHYKTIGYDIKLDLMLLFTMMKYIFQGISFLRQCKSDGKKNVLYCYGGLTLENIIFVLFGRLFGYLVVLDIVEDNTFIKERMHLLGKLKWQTGELMERYIPQLANGLVVISSYLQRLYQKEFGTAVPICLIPICARCQQRPVKKQDGGPVKFVYSGSFAKKDGLEVLIKAFEQVHEKVGNCTLILTGTGSNVPEYQRLIAGHPAIRYMGYLDDSEFVAFLQKADVLCITRTGSTYANAGFPFKLGEYLATGNPVVVSDVGDVSYYLENMKDAIIVKADDVAEVEKAMEFCIRNPEEVSQIGLNGQLKCKQYFDPSIIGSKFLELMHRL
jgi:glycosyltransferase involved in cell wall biosynthesis